MQKMWTELLELFRTVLNNITDETMGDWEQCLSGATNKADPNRFVIYHALVCITPPCIKHPGILS